MTIVDSPIRMRIRNHVQYEWLTNQPNWIFIPKKLAIRVGGMSISDMRVNTFMILFWSRLMIPSTVF